MEFCLAVDRQMLALTPNPFRVNTLEDAFDGRLESVTHLPGTALSHRLA
jgi:hypothetical protein